MNYYDILEVEPDATPAMIRTAYKKLVEEGQPENGNEESGDPAMKMRLAQIVEAYMVLSDKEKRAAYDEAINNLAAIQGMQVDDDKKGKRLFVLGRAGRNPRQLRLLLLTWGITMIAVLAAMQLATKKLTQPTAPPPASQPVAAPKPEEAATKSPAPSAEAAPSQAEAAAAYLVPALVTGLQVALKHPDRPEENSGRTLSIPTISVKLGGRDPEVTAVLLREKIDSLRLRLKEDLSRARIGEMMTADGEEYLTQMIQGAIFQAVPESRAETGGNIKVLMPDRFEVN